MGEGDEVVTVFLLKTACSKYLL